MEVEYRTIAGFPDYQVGDDGSVWSRRRYGWWRQLKPAPGHLCLLVLLYRTRRIRFTRAVHRLVLEAFVGPCPEGMECCHFDGNFRNNALSNLRWDTRTGNAADRARHGRQPRGERIHLAVLTAEKVRQIVRLLDDHISQKRIAKQFGIDQSAVSSINCGRTWRHVTERKQTRRRLR